MDDDHSDRVVRVLAAAVGVAYFGMWVAAVVVLVGAPALKLLAGSDSEWVWGLQVPATVSNVDATVPASWGEARLQVEDVRADLRLPLATLPWWLFALLWAHAAATAAVMLSFLYHLRRIFQRTREGAPFDSRNAVGLRSLGLLLLAYTVLEGLAETLAAMAVRGGFVDQELVVSAGLFLDLRLVFVALVLIALAEVFRRGAKLEEEQALVV